MKKKIKIEQEQVFGLLNENLKEKITVCMNGIVLQTIPFFESFNMEFVSEMTFHLRSKTYAMDDNIFVVSVPYMWCSFRKDNKVNRYTSFNQVDVPLYTEKLLLIWMSL